MSIIYNKLSNKVIRVATEGLSDLEFNDGIRIIEQGTLRSMGNPEVTIMDEDFADIIQHRMISTYNPFDNWDFQFPVC